MKLCEYIRPELVIVDIEGSDQTQVLTSVCERAEKHLPQLDLRQILERLIEREKVATTGLGSGVAVPHATVANVENTVLIIARLAQPVDFNSLDGEPVEIMFVLLSHSDNIASHIRLLARIARLCSRQEFLDKMIAAQSDKELYEIIIAEDSCHV